MRSLMRSFLGLHFVQFTVSLAILGFLPMLEDLAFGALVFSCYLTLQDWLISTYLLLMASSATFGYYQLFIQGTIIEEADLTGS